MKYIILDLEATCWQERGKSPNEIIEIGALCFNQNKEKIGEFSRFVKPVVHQQLSAFCTELTSITQADVNDEPTFPSVISDFQNWLSSFEDDYLLCSWGFYDKNQFEADCKLHDLKTDWVENHISLKHQYAQICNVRSIGMKGAILRENMKLDGTHHRGIDDARNIAKIFIKYFEQWDFSYRRA